MSDRQVLTMDIGGTNPRICAVGIRVDGSFELQGAPHALMGSGSDFFDEIKRYIAKLETKPMRCCACVAGEIIENQVHSMANAKHLKEVNDLEQELGRELGLETLLINDFEAIAHGVCTYDIPKDVDKPKTAKQIQGKNKLIQLPVGGRFAEPIPNRDRAVVGPGTGLGVAYIVVQGEKRIIRASEGGHGTFGCPAEYAPVQNYLERVHAQSRLGMEAYASGRAITNIAKFLLSKEGEHLMSAAHVPSDTTLKEHIESLPEDKIPPLVASKVNESQPCKKAMELFFEFLATACSTVALHGLCFGGLFLAGGILPKNKELLFQSTFMSGFVKNWRKSALLEKIPVYLVDDYDISFLGAARAAVEKLSA